MMLSSEVCRWLLFWDRLGRAAINSVSDKEKPIAVPKDWGMFIEELGCAWSFNKLGLEQSVQEKKSQNNAVISFALICTISNRVSINVWAGALCFRSVLTGSVYCLLLFLNIIYSLSALLWPPTDQQGSRPPCLLKTLSVRRCFFLTESISLMGINGFSIRSWHICKAPRVNHVVVWHYINGTET